MEVQRDGSLEKGSVDLVLNPSMNVGPGIGGGHNVSVDASLGIITNSNNHNTINYNDNADTSE
jgi:hypothetical protein